MVLRKTVAALGLPLVLLLLGACGPAEHADEGVDFVAVPARQVAGEYETGQWFRTGDDSWRIDDSLEPALALYQNRSFDDVSLELSVTLEHGEEASLVLSHSEAGYYYLGVGSYHHRYVIARHQADRPRWVLESYGLAQDIEEGTELLLGAAVEYGEVSARLTLTVDGQVVLEHEDYEPLPGGLVGLRSFRTVASFRLVRGPD